MEEFPDCILETCSVLDFGRKVVACDKRSKLLCGWLHKCPLYGIPALFEDEQFHPQRTDRFDAV
jgi:hypothetical protein